MAEGAKGFGGAGAHSHTPTGSDDGRLYDEVIADFRVEMKARRAHRAVDYFTGGDLEQLPAYMRDRIRAADGKRKPFLQSTDYPWLKPGWKW